MTNPDPTPAAISTATPLFSTTLEVQGVKVYINGPSNDPKAPTVVMIHGWPDTCALWDDSVTALKDRYRCVRFTLPGFDNTLPARPTSAPEMVQLFAAIINKVSPFEPVTLMLHDWGCIFGYEYAALNASRVSRVVGLDIGDHNSSAFHRSLKRPDKLMIFGYQIWLALAWKIGEWLGKPLGDLIGNGMTRWMGRAMGCRSPAQAMTWQMNYPYAMQWFGLLGGFKKMQRGNLPHPMLFVYGEHKPFMFHSPQWAIDLATRKGCEVQPLKTGHWVMSRHPAQFTALVRAWLDKG